MSAARAPAFLDIGNGTLLFVGGWLEGSPSLSSPMAGFRGGGPLPVLAEWRQFPPLLVPGRGRVKSAEEIMNILEAYDLTGSLRDAAELAGCSHHAVAPRRPGVIDEFLPKLEEYVERAEVPSVPRRAARMSASLRPTRAEDR